MHSWSTEINSHITVLFVSLNERKLSKRASAVFFLFARNKLLKACINSHISVLFVSLNERELRKRASADFFLREINSWRLTYSIC